MCASKDECVVELDDETGHGSYHLSLAVISS